MVDKTAARAALTKMLEFCKEEESADWYPNFRTLMDFINGAGPAVPDLAHPSLPNAPIVKPKERYEIDRRKPRTVNRSGWLGPREG
jgi:hypothetical protein